MLILTANCDISFLWDSNSNWDSLIYLALISQIIYIPSFDLLGNVLQGEECVYYCLFMQKINIVTLNLVVINCVHLRLNCVFVVAIANIFVPF